MAEEQIIISVDVDAAKAATELGNTIKRIAELKEEQKQLTKEIRAGNDVDGEKAARLVQVQGELARANNAQKQYTAAVQQGNKAAQPYGDSLNEMRRKLSDLTKSYDAMSKAQRESASGTELLEAIQQQTEAVSELERESGRWQRNVGDYPSALESVIPYFSQFKGALSALGVSFATLSKGGTAAFAALAAGARALGVALLTPPIGVIVAILAAVAALVKLFKEGFEQINNAIKRNDDQSTRLAATWARFTPIITALRKMFERLAEGVVKVVEGFGRLVDWTIKLANKVGLVSDSFMQQSEGAVALTQAIDKLEDVERQHAVNAAKREREISELRAKAADKDAYNAKQRIAFLEQAMALEQANLDEERKIANARYLIVVAQNKQMNDTSDDAKNAEIEALTKVEEAEKRYADNTRRLTAQIVAARKEQATAAQAAAKQAADAAKAAKDEEERTAKELEAQRAAEAAEAAKQEEARQETIAQIRKDYEDAMAAQIADETERAIAQEHLRTQREVQALEERRALLAETDIVARDELNAIIEQKQEESNQRIFEINKKADDANEERDRRAAEARKAQVQAITNAVIDSGQALAEFATEVAGKNKATAIMGKAVALGQIAISSGTAIAKGVESASGVAFPANLAAIATTIATVLANIATATKTVNAAKFAQGGVVAGSSWSGDNVVARVNSGEMILPRSEQAGLWRFIKSGSKVNDDNYQAMAAAMATAVAQLPSPTLVYDEYRQFESRTINIRESAKL